MSRKMKSIGEERRSRILQLLKETKTPITGSELAAKTNVSRQAIVGDITLLKARNEPIIATRQGYMYLKQAETVPCYEKKFTCRHLPDHIEKEFNLIVDHGVTIKDLQIQHPVFGTITASIMVSNRMEVKQFMEKLSDTKNSFLPESTIETHLLTLTSASNAALNEVEIQLHKEGFLNTDISYFRSD